MEGSNVKWRVDQVAQVKTEVKGAIDIEYRKGDRAIARRFIDRQISELQDDTSDLGQLRRLVYVMSGLVHHERFGGGSSRKVRRLTALAYAIMQAQGIKPITSRLAFLYGELHLVLSQIHRKSGRHLYSAWQQQVSWHMSRKMPTGGSAFQNFSMALRSLRLGHADVALPYLEAAELVSEKDTSVSQAVRARFERIKTLRLAGDLVAAEALSAVTAQEFSLGETEQTELKWEALCRKAQVDRDVEGMVRAVTRGGTHHRASYILEAYLWAQALPGRRSGERFVKMRNLVRQKELKVRKQGHFYRAALAIEDCNENLVPFAQRLQRLGAEISQSGRIATVDKELLFLAAAARWLARAHLFFLATIVLRQYQALSRNLTSGRSMDALNVVSDLAERPWIHRASDTHDQAS